MTYLEKLKDPRWQKRRLEILSRDKFTCQNCGDSTKTLHVHHKVYLGEYPWETPDWALTTLCLVCHELEEAIKKHFGSKERYPHIPYTLVEDIYEQLGYLVECYDDGRMHILRKELLAFLKEKRIENDFYWD